MACEPSWKLPRRELVLKSRTISLKLDITTANSFLLAVVVYPNHEKACLS
jgi:hypothetical protein